MMKGLGDLADMTKLVKGAQEMQEKMEQLKKDMAEEMVTGESGAGMVKAISTARGSLKSLEIDPSLLRPEDKEVAEDLIVAAVNDSKAKADARMREEVDALMASLNLPKGMDIPV